MPVPAIALVGSLIVSGQLSAQPVSIVPPEVVTRPRMEVTWHEVTRLRSSVDVTLVPATQVHANQERFVVSPLIEGYTWAEYDVDGRLIGLRGQRGQGPGEFLRVHRAVPTVGGTLVFDGQKASQVASDGEYLDGRFLPGVPLAVVPLASGGLVAPFAGYSERAERTVLAFFDSDGRLVDKVFVKEPEPFPLSNGRAAGDGIGSTYFVRVSPDDEMYEIAEVGFDGAVRRILRRYPRWYVPPEERSDGAWPRTSAMTVHVQDDQLWILFAIRKPSAGFGIGDAGILGWEEDRDFFLEVIDLRNEQLLASEQYRSPPYHSSVGVGGVVTRTLEAELTGLIDLSVRRIRLHVEQDGGDRE